MNLTFCCSICFALLYAMTVNAQESPNAGASRKQATAVRVGDGDVRVDGFLAEEVWHRAPAITDFVQKEPTEGAAPTDPMEVRFAYDSGSLYVGARMRSRDRAVIQAPMGRRDNVEAQSEHILISLDTFLDRRTAYSFGVSASGVRIDRFYPRDEEETFEAGFDPVWQAKTQRDEEGWTAELWIPFSQLRFNDQPTQMWGLNIQRFTPTLEELDYWVPVPRTERAWASRFGDLRGLAGIPSTRRIELLPFLVGSSTMDGLRDPANPFDDGRNLASRTGLDMKMGLGPNLTLQATANPDFGQVEADPAEVNLSAIPTRFVEKRPFFTEDAELLNIAHNNLFYSRRIGARPLGSASGDFVDYPTAETILGAAKLTGRLRPRTSLGVLGAVTNEESARVANLTSQEIVTLRVAPRTTYGLARLQQEFGRLGSTASVMVVGMHRALTAGDPLSNLLTRNAIVVGGDTLLRLKGGEYELRASGGGTVVSGEAKAMERIQLSSTHFAQRPDKDYSRFDPMLTSLTGYALQTSFNRISGRHWLWGASSKLDSPGLEPNDVGFLRGADGIEQSAFLRYRETQPGRIFRNYSVEIRRANERNYAGDRQSGSWRPSVSATWRNFWTSSFAFARTMAGNNWQLTRGGPLMGTPRGWNATATIGNRTTANTRWSGTAMAAGNEDGGRTRNVNLSFSLRPGPQWQVAITPSYERLIDTQQYITTLSGGRPATYGSRYIFGAIERSTLSTEFRLNFTFKPDLNLDVYAEPFAASGHYYDIGELLVRGTRLRLTYGTAGTTADQQPDGSLRVATPITVFTVPNTDFNVRSFRSTIVLRYEWRPGSTLYAVWQQDKQALDPIGTRVGMNDMFRSVTQPGTNVLLIKTSFWLPVR